jgi:lysozyme family protein
VRAIYRERYWRPSKAQFLPPPLGLMHFDAAVNHGVVGAARLLQQALGVTEDGDIGPETLAAAARQPVVTSLERYADRRRARYRSLGHFWRFGRGWLARVDATLNAAKELTSQPSTNGVPAMPDTTAKPNPPAPEVTAPSAPTTKWWGHSITIWGTLITALTTVLPLLGPALGLDLKPELVRQLGDNLVVVAQAVTGLAGTLMALYGRAIAVTQLERRNVTLQI